MMLYNGPINNDESGYKNIYADAYGAHKDGLYPSYVAVVISEYDTEDRENLVNVARATLNADAARLFALQLLAAAESVATNKPHPSAL